MTETADGAPVELEEPCAACGGNDWDVYRPDGGVADVWYECLTPRCIGVRFASPVRAGTSGSDGLNKSTTAGSSSDDASVATETDR